MSKNYLSTKVHNLIWRKEEDFFNKEMRKEQKLIDKMMLVKIDYLSLGFQKPRETVLCAAVQTLYLKVLQILETLSFWKRGLMNLKIVWSSLNGSARVLKINFQTNKCPTLNWTNQDSQ